ncbi:MAG TPA: class I tRNA ligase family protein, partial [Candidatus Paceibacterota bacterium]
YLGVAQWKEVEFVPFPHDRNFELDFHRPYIDEIKLRCECGGEMKRIPEVVDCWVESGSMPFAEYHYPFENKSEFEKRSPGDFIAEYVGQTRTWFYYLHTVSTLLFGHEAFKNVVVTGNILAADGSKMSKSKGNYTDPLELIARYGADAYRYHLMTSVVMQAEDFNFTDDGVKEVYQRLVNILWNTVQFYLLYVPVPDSKVRPRGGPEVEPSNPSSSPNVLDRWILARLAQLHKEVTENLDKYDTIKAGRPIRDFVTDFSTWYIRRSRDRFKAVEEVSPPGTGGLSSATDRDYAIATTRFVLLELAKLIAPFMPFLAEQIYKAVGGPLQSVHLENWNNELGITNYDQDMIREMTEVRRIVSLGLEARQTAGIKVRQPLAKLIILNSHFIIQKPELAGLVKDEVNVKELESGDELKLDTTITPELKLEGDMRDLVRQIQEKRKEMGLAPSDKINVTLPQSLGPLSAKFGEEIKKSVSASSLAVDDVVETKIEKV